MKIGLGKPLCNNEQFEVVAPRTIASSSFCTAKFDFLDLLDLRDRLHRSTLSMKTRYPELLGTARWLAEEQLHAERRVIR
jgi:hypothetical protein